MLMKIPRAKWLMPIIVVSPILCWSGAARAQSTSLLKGLPSIEAKTAEMRHLPGFLPLHWDARGGRLYLEIPKLDLDMLYFDSLPFGTGSNELGLDRGQVSSAKLVRFERFGP